jgi:hypothetical protein
MPAGRRAGLHATNRRDGPARRDLQIGTGAGVRCQHVSQRAERSHTSGKPRQVSPERAADPTELVAVAVRELADEVRAGICQ